MLGAVTVGPTEQEVMRAFAPLRGRYVWGVRTGAESLLSFEVGEPRLEVHEHLDGRGEPRREVTACGRYRFALVDCRFELALDGETLATDEHGDGTVARAGQRLSGQALEGVSLEGDVLRLSFDLGGSLRVWRHPQSEAGAVVWELVGDDTPCLFRA